MMNDNRSPSHHYSQVVERMGCRRRCYVVADRRCFLLLLVAEVGCLISGGGPGFAYYVGGAGRRRRDPGSVSDGPAGMRAAKSGPPVRQPSSSCHRPVARVAADEKVVLPAARLLSSNNAAFSPSSSSSRSPTHPPPAPPPPPRCPT